jgi:magnesium transporter
VAHHAGREEQKMANEYDPRPWEQLERIVEQGDASVLEQYLDQLSSGELARALSRLELQEQHRILQLLPAEEAADLVEQLPESQAVELFQELPAKEAAEILYEMQSNERADLLGGLHEDGVEAILEEMVPEAASETRQLVSYPTDVAGGLMITEYLWFPQTTEVGEVIRDFREHAEAYSDYDIQYTYVVSGSGELVGVLRLRDLLLAPRDRRIADIMITDPLRVSDATPLTELGEFFDQHNFVGVPVTDPGGKLVGVVRRVDVEEALADRSESDYLKSQGIVGGEELRTMPLLRRSTRRLSWLSINIFLNMIAASVIAFYQDTLSAVIALAVFLPIISDMSGCSGNQAVAVSIRELSLGLIKPFEVLRVWGKELAVGVINGTVLGLLLGCAAWIWKGSVFLGLVVAAAMSLNTLVAVSIGGTVPLVLKLFRTDPALASGPILTTITDMCGFFFVLSFATIMLSRLT